LKDEEKTEILLEAINVYGLSNQLLVLSEECSEVIKEIMKIKRWHKTSDKWQSLIEEIADLDVVLDQFKLIYIDDILEAKDKKMERLKGRLQEQKGNYLC